MARATAHIARAREAKAWDLLSKGYTQRRIAEEMQVDPSTVCHMLKRTREAVLKTIEDNILKMKADQTAVLEHIIEESMDAWERSKLNAESEKTTTEKIAGGGAGKAETSGEANLVRSEKWSKGQTGDPRHLAEARQSLASIREIWGIDAPKKSDVTSGGQRLPIQLVEVVRPVPMIARETAAIGGPEDEPSRPR